MNIQHEIQTLQRQVRNLQTQVETLLGTPATGEAHQTVHVPDPEAGEVDPGKRGV